MMTALLIIIAIIAARALQKEFAARRTPGYQARRLEGSIERAIEDARARAADEARRNDCWRASYRAGMPL